MVLSKENVFASDVGMSAKSSQAQPSQISENNIFANDLQGIKPSEGFGKSVARTTAQLPLGYASKWTWPLAISTLVGQGEALAEWDELQERLPKLKEMFPDAPWENFEGLDEEKYLQAVEAAGKSFPTQQNVERWTEEKTGVPLQPKTELQKGLRLGGTAFALRPGTLPEKGTAAVIAPIAAKALEAGGVPEGIAETTALVASGIAPSPNISKVTKPSGLTTRRFETLKKPTTVSPQRYEKITQAIETDFKALSEDLLKKNKTYSAMKEDSLFKEKIGGLFEKVEEVAADIKTPIHTQDVRDVFRRRYNSRETKGFSPGESETAYRKEIKRLNKNIPHEEIYAPQLVEQFRKNNQDLAKFYEPGKSKSFNEGKKEALLDYNRAIVDTIEQEYPDFEFNKLFKFTNKRWQEINDIESIENFLNELFEGKIDYKKAKDIFSKDKAYVSRPFKRILGEEGFNNFKTLTEDLLSTEKSYAMLKKARADGYKDLVQLGAEYAIHPKVAGVHHLSKSAKTLYQMLLDKPQIAVKWKSALENLNMGNFIKAERQFKELDEISKEK
jgi:hypothetical protein